MVPRARVRSASGVTATATRCPARYQNVDPTRPDVRTVVAEVRVTFFECARPIAYLVV